MSRLETSPRRRSGSPVRPKVSILNQLTTRSMDALTHVFLPLTAVYALRRELVLDSPWVLVVAGVGLFPDFDKFLGAPGALHSLVTLVPLCLLVVGVEYALRGELAVTPVLVAVVLSHLVLDVVDGGPVPVLYPLVEGGIGFEYPIRAVFGAGPVGVSFEGPVVSLRETSPRPGFNTYGFVNGFGVASVLLFATIVVSDALDGRGEPT